MKYLVWSEEHGAWWGDRPGHGYTRSLKAAGRYDLFSAEKIVIDANKHLPPGEFNELLVPDPTEEVPE